MVSRIEFKEFTNIKAESPGQEKMFDALFDPNVEIIGVFGPTGTGKSLISIIIGIEFVLQGVYERFIVSKPIMSRPSPDNSHGFSSSETYRQHIVDYLKDLVVSIAPDKVKLIDELLESEKIVIVDPYYIRGRTFDSSYILLDDVQNVEPELVVEVITRLGRNSKLVIAGDPVFQAHNPWNGALLARDVLSGEPSAQVIDLGLKDIVRPGAKRGIRLLVELMVRKRTLNTVEKSVLESLRIHAPDADVVTVVDLTDVKKTFSIEQEHVPDALVIVKEGHLGRAIGVQGKRIESVEEDTGLSIRVTELTLDFKNYFRAIHPVSWIHKHIIDADIAGSDIIVVVKKGELGPMVGQKGYYAKFMEHFFKKVFNSGLRIIESQEEHERKALRKRRK